MDIALLYPIFLEFFLLKGLARFVDGPGLLKMVELNFCLPNCFPIKAIVVSVLAENLAKIRDSSKSCAIMVLNSGGLAFF